MRVMCITSLDDSASKRVLNLLELQLRVRKIVAQRVTEVTFGVNNGGSDDTDGFRVQVRTDATKFANMRITGFRQCRDLDRERKVFVEYKA